MKIYEYQFLRSCKGIAINQYDYYLPKCKEQTNSWSVQDIKLEFDESIPKKFSIILLQTKDIPNKINETVDFTKENLITDEEIAISKNHFPMLERKNILLDSYFLYDRGNFVKTSFISELHKFISIYG